VALAGMGAEPFLTYRDKTRADETSGRPPRISLKHSEATVAVLYGIYCAT